MNRPLDSLILTIRGQKVILDADLAAIYGVAIKVLNQAIKRNSDRFPADFMFQLSEEEFVSLRSQIVTLKTEAPDVEADDALRSQFATLKTGRGQHRKYMRRFYMEWQNRVPQIAQTVSGQLPPVPIPQTPSGKSTEGEISPSASDQLAIQQTPSAKFKGAFTLSWSHYVELLGIKDSDERSFYEIEARQSDWDVRELRRQKASCLYERLANIHAKEYQLYLPSKELLRQKLIEWARAAESGT